MARIPTGRPPGPPPRPVEEKRRLGNPGRRPLPEPILNVVMLAADAEPPEPSRPLGTHGRACWDRTWRGARSWLAVGIDDELVQMLAESVDEHTALRFRALSDPDDWRARTQLRQLDSQILALLVSTGLTPADRGRVAPSAEPVDQLALLRAMRTPRKDTPS